MILNEQSNIDRRELEFLRDDKLSQHDSYDQDISDGQIDDGSNQDQDMNYGDAGLLKRQDDISREDQNKQIIKVDCLEKLKGYFGFGQYLTVSFIGFVFVIPISKNWSFKVQAMIAQMAIIAFGFTLFITIKYAGQSVAQNVSDNWRGDVFENSVGSLLLELKESYDELLNQTIISNQKLMEKSHSFLLNQSQIKLNSSFANQKIDLQPYYIYQTNLTNQNVSIDNSTLIMEGDNYSNQSEYFMSLNYITPYLNNKEYSTVGYYYWTFYDGAVDIQFPGETFEDQSDVKSYRNYHQNVLQNETSDFFFNSKYENYLAYFQFSLPEFNGSSYYAMDLMKLVDLFVKLHQNTTIIKMIVFDLEDNTTLINQAQGKVKPHKITQMNNFESTADQQYSKMQSRNNTVTYFYYTYLTRQDLGLKFFILYNVSSFSELIAQQHIKFYRTADGFEKTYLPVFITIPFSMFFIFLILLSRRIYPIEQITNIAYLSLKKNQKLNQEELDQINGDGPIQKLIQLFKNLILELAGLKVGNKESLSQHYKQQTYPFNNKERDLSQIRDQIQKFRGMNQTLQY